MWLGGGAALNDTRITLPSAAPHEGGHRLIFGGCLARWSFAFGVLLQPESRNRRTNTCCGWTSCQVGRRGLRRRVAFGSAPPRVLFKLCRKKIYIYIFGLALTLVASGVPPGLAARMHCFQTRWGGPFPAATCVGKCKTRGAALQPCLAMLASELHCVARLTCTL